MEEKLLVCTVYAGGDRDSFWFNLQSRQLRATTGSFDHAIYLGSRASPSDYEGALILGQCTDRQFEQGWQEHLWGLFQLAEFCRISQQRYSGFLVLDSDAFPVAAGWKDYIDKWLIERNKQYAAAIRLENLDTFPHPCIVYTRDAHTLLFDRKEHTNLLGRVFSDITCLSDRPLPLIRTNSRTVHPVLASVYLNLFYHHGCGSRHFQMRAMRSGYYSHIADSYTTDDPVFERLRADPSKFISMLMAAPD